jgi:hypothetical protein
MKISQIFAVTLLLVMGSMMAFADGIHDPRIVIHGVNGGNAPVVCPNQGCTNVGLNFAFSAPASGTGTLFFTNTSGQNWSSLTLVEQGHAVPASAITCHSNLFSSCMAETLKNGNVAIVLSGTRGNNPDRGIANGQSFAIAFSCVNNNCWPGGLKFGGHANSSATSVPEPGTIAFMVTGLGALISRRKTWMNRWNS